MARSKFEFYSSRADGDGREIDTMAADSRPVTLKTFSQRCDTRVLALHLGYADDARPAAEVLEGVRFFRSAHYGRPCYYALHAATAYIFTERR